MNVAISTALLYYSASCTLLVLMYFINDDERTRWMDVSWLAVLLCTLLVFRVMRDGKEPIASLIAGLRSKRTHA